MRIPRHIGVIPDGNRRWAVEHGLNRQDGYDFGLAPGLRLLQRARAHGITEITYYGFTVDNCKRPSAQKDAFTKACVDAVQLLSREGASLLVVGNDSSPCFPDALRPYTTRTDLHGGGLRINFLVNYGWEWDLAGALASKSPSGREIRRSLHSREVSDMDLVIRWGGMRRLSGFLPAQSVYADFYVVDALWPDYADVQLEDALVWYDRQDVTRGG